MFRAIQNNRLLTAIFIIGTLFQSLFLFSHDFHFFLTNTLPDDAFYYFTIAREIAGGAGSTFDGINITNGYHPLWMILIVPLFKLFSVGGVSDINPIYASLVLSLLFSVITGGLLVRLFRRFTENAYILSFMLFFWFFNPYNLYAVFNGLETSLTLCLLTGFILSICKLANTEPVLNKRNLSGLSVFGVLGGLLILARLDTIFIVFFGFLFLLYRFFRKGSILWLTVPACITICIYGVWQIWNYITYGMMLTSASITSTYIHHSLTYYDNGGKSLFLVLKTMVYMFDRAFGQFIENTGAPYVVVPIVGIAVYFFAKQFGGFWSQLKNRNLSPLWFISLGLVAQMFVSASVRWVFRDWYFIPTLFVVQFIVLFALIQLSKEFKNFKYVIGIFMIMSAGFFYISYEKNLKDREILQDTMWKAALWQNERVPVGSKIGAFNSGIQGYFSIHTVVNLDGLVNNVASAYMLKHDMWKYITGVENLDYVSDFPKYINYKFDRFFGVGIQSVHILPQLELIHTIMGGPQDLNVYKVLYK